MYMRRVNLAYILKSLWLMNPQAAEAYYPLIFNMLENPLTEMDKPEDRVNEKLFGSIDCNSVYPISAYGEASPPEDAPEGSIAVVEFFGAITKFDQWCGDSGTETKAHLIARCFENENISGIVLKIDSGGGSGDAIQCLKDCFGSANKPVMTYVDGMAASAAYWIASQTDHIMIGGKMSEVGSIGAYIPLNDFTEYYKKLGIDIKRIYSRLSPEKNKAFEEVLKGNEEPMKDDLDAFVNFFHEDVKSGRPDLKTSADPKIMQGAMYFAEQAVSNGLADSIGTFTQAVQKCIEMSNTKGGVYV